jgi:hypothetical protein
MSELKMKFFVFKVLWRGKESLKNSSNGLGIHCSFAGLHDPTQELVDDIGGSPTDRIRLFWHIVYGLHT